MKTEMNFLCLYTIEWLQLEMTAGFLENNLFGRICYVFKEHEYINNFMVQSSILFYWLIILKVNNIFIFQQILKLHFLENVILNI